MESFLEFKGGNAATCVAAVGTATTSVKAQASHRLLGYYQATRGLQ
jgi:hypothetical protein